MRARLRILMMRIMMMRIMTMTTATTIMMIMRRRKKWKIIESACLFTASQVEVAKPVTVPGQGSYLRFEY